MLQLTEQAIHKAKEFLASQGEGAAGLRVSVHGGGCSGFQYALSFASEQKPDDHVLEFNGLRVFVDAASRPYLAGVRIDYLDTLKGSGFKIENPNATGSCGCGASFSA